MAVDDVNHHTTLFSRRGSVDDSEKATLALNVATAPINGDDDRFEQADFGRTTAFNTLGEVAVSSNANRAIGSGALGGIQLKLCLDAVSVVEVSHTESTLNPGLCAGENCSGDERAKS
jgi:hypothetical protein